MQNVNLQAIQVANYGKIEYVFKPVDEIGEAIFNVYRDLKANDPKFKIDRTTFTHSMLVEVCNMLAMHNKSVQFKVSDIKELKADKPLTVGANIIASRGRVDSASLDFL